jgi:dTMP kinase
MKGLFVTFEGPEGAGKSTCLQTVASRLQREIFVTREPGAGEFGRRIRAMLLDEEDLPPESELMLFLADRANHVVTMIQPALFEGKIVLCDRHADSTLVYQGYARGLDRDFLQVANRFATRGLVPDVTFLFDLDPQIGLDRIQARKDSNRMDREPLEFHVKVRNGFLAVAANEPNRFVVLDATKSPADLADEVFAEILRRS